MESTEILDLIRQTNRNITHAVEAAQRQKTAILCANGRGLRAETEALEASLEKLALCQDEILARFQAVGITRFEPQRLAVIFGAELAAKCEVELNRFRQLSADLEQGLQANRAALEATRGTIKRMIADMQKLALAGLHSIPGLDRRLAGAPVLFSSDA